MSEQVQPAPASELSSKQRAAAASTQIRRLQGHDRRVAAGIPCRRCWVCFPETGKRETRPETRRDRATAQPSLYSETPKEQTFSDRALVLAEAGTSEETAALIIGEDVPTFQAKIQETYGITWDTVCQRAKAKVRADLIVSAIRAARLGDWKAYLSLEKAGVKLSLVDREEEETAKTPQTLAEVEKRIAELTKENEARLKTPEANLDLSSFEGVSLLE